MGILELVIPADRAVSEKAADAGELLSHREKQQGIPMAAMLKKDDSTVSKILFQQYLMEKLGNYRNPADAGLQYQIEYILGGKYGDIDNLKVIARKLLLIREGVNIACLAADAGKRAEVHTLALSIASLFLIPPAAAVIEGAILLCWSFAESVLDVRKLFAGGKVPIVKDRTDWQLSLEKLPYLLENLDSSGKPDSDGISYEDYLQILLLMESKEREVTGGMDMLELEIREKGRENFRLDFCITALEASVDVRANKRKVFTAARKYSYD